MKHLAKDKKLVKILMEPLPPLHLHKNIALRLIASIMGQQLSTKVAKVIYHRFLELFDGKEPKSQQVLDTPSVMLRNIGLSNAKVSYVKNVAEFCIKNKISDKKLLKMSNREIIDKLVAIKGVGQWTVEMLLMFTLGREDVFALDDLGIQQAMAKLYNLETSNKKLLKEKMAKLADKWSPYRTYACLHLWQWKDMKPVVKE